MSIKFFIIYIIIYLYTRNRVPNESNVSKEAIKYFRMNYFNSKLLLLAVSSMIANFFIHCMEEKTGVTTKDKLSTYKLTYTLKGHFGAARLVAFSPEGKTALTGSDDGKARLWDASAGKQIQVLKGHINYVTSVAFSSDGKTALTRSDDGKARLWDTSTGKQIHVLKGHISYVTSVVFSPDGKTVLIGSGDSIARLWNVATGKEIHILKGHMGPFWSVAFSPDGKRTYWFYR